MVSCHKRKSKGFPRGSVPLSEENMNYTFAKQDDKVNLGFTVTAPEWDEYLNKVYNRNKNKFSVPGFRKGHASRKMIEKLYGAGVFFDDAFDLCFKEAYSKVLDENPAFYPVDEPQVDIEKLDDNELKFGAVVTVKPEVKLGDYTGIKLAKVEYTVTAAELDAEMEKVRERGSRMLNVEGRAVENGDTVTLDYCGKINEVAFNGGTANNQQLTIGSNTFIPGFEEQMVGMNVGETRDLKVKFPEDYQAEELKGKEAVFTVTLHGIKRKELPELSDELVKDITGGKFETVDAYREDANKRLESEYVRRADTENENALIARITENAEIKIPACMVDTQLNYMVKDFEMRLGYMYGGMKLEDYFKYTDSSLEQYREDNRLKAEQTVKTRLVLEAIVAKENMEVTDDELNAEINKRAEAAKKSETEYRKQLDPRQTAYIKNDLLMDKLLNFLKNNNIFEAK